MKALLNLILLLIFIFIWYRPVLKRHKEIGGYVDRKTEYKALFFGLVPAAIVLLLAENALGWIFKLTGASDHKVLMCFLKAFIMYGCIEEAVKYGFARLALRKLERVKKIDIMIVFGFVGMGYEIAESMLIADPLAGIARGIFVAHIMYQFVMGHFFFESIHAKNLGNDADAKKNMFYSLAIPMLIHGINDLFCELAGVFQERIPNTGSPDISAIQYLPAIVCVVMIIITNIFCLVWGLKLTKKDPDVEAILPDC